MLKSVHLKTSMLQYAARHVLLKSDNKVLVAVSGGIDSMVLLSLLQDADINTVAAHCNFSLRGEESDLDEDFVKTETCKLGVSCRVKRFDTIDYAAQNGLSIQMAARDLRYRWFQELAIEENYDAIAIAHNRDDRIETLLINLARGTGLHGLTGIKPKNGKIIRPLLFASRNEIEEYANEHGVKYREDSSNTTDEYARNYIRHHVIPGMEQFFPGVRQTMERSMDYFSEVEMFYDETIERYRNQIVSVKEDLTYIDLAALVQSPSPPTLLYEILKPFGFSNSVTAKIIENQNFPSGRQFFSDTFRLVCDRKSLILQKIENERLQEYLIDEQTSQIYIPIHLKINKFEKYHEYKPDTHPNVACLDGGKLHFPLLLRQWKHGDKFRPLGMKNMKKLSDFFTDAKLSLIEKERCWVLISGNKIVWIAGMRIDDRFKITDKTNAVVELRIDPDQSEKNAH